ERVGPGRHRRLACSPTQVVEGEHRPEGVAVRRDVAGEGDRRGALDRRRRPVQLGHLTLTLRATLAGYPPLSVHWRLRDRGGTPTRVSASSAPGGRWPLGAGPGVGPARRRRPPPWPRTTRPRGADRA